MYRYAIPYDGQMNWVEFDKHRLSIQLRVCNVLLQWSKKYTTDFQHPEHGSRTCQQLLDFVDHVLAQEHPTMAKQIRKSVLKLV